MTSTELSTVTESRFPARPSGRGGRLFHGWKVAGAGAVIQLMHAGLILQAFGHYAVMLEKQFGWSRTVIATAYSFNRAESGLLGPIQGWLLVRFGARRVMRTGIVLLCLGFLLFSRVQTPIQFILTFFLMAVGAGLSGFLTISSETVKWFERRRARALSLTMSGFAVGGIVVPGVVWFMTRYGWRATAVASAVLVAAVMLPLSKVFGHSPTSLRQPIDGIHPDELPSDPRHAQRGSGYHFTVREALRTRAFWFLSFGHASALLVTGAVLAHLALFLTNERDLSLQTASYVGAGLTLLQLIGMIGGGVLGDRLDKRLICSFAMLGHSAGLLVLTYGGGTWSVIAFVVLHGLAWGVRGPLMNAMRADYFGATAYGQIMGFASIIAMFGMVGGPLLAGILADTFGDYRVGFTILALLALGGTLLVLAATPPKAPSAPSAPSMS